MINPVDTTPGFAFVGAVAAGRRPVKETGVVSVPVPPVLEANFRLMLQSVPVV